MALKTVKCGKCEGRGNIEAFAGIADGVCFACKGRGTVTFDETRKSAEIGEYTKTRCEWILKADSEAVSGWSYDRLFKLRDFAKKYMMNAAADMFYGDTVHAAYCEKFESAFLQAQEEKLAAFYANDNS